MNWRVVIYILLFVVLFWGLEHSRRQLWEPDEARYAYVAKEMMQDGHWAVPHRHGIYYAHKPPLYFWLIRFAVSLTGRGVDGVTARLPSLMASFVSLLLTGLFAAKLFGKKAVLPSVLILSTSYLVWHEGGMGRMDSVLLALELCALYFLLKGDERRSDAWRATGFIFMGLGVLAKGPVGLIVPLLAYLAVRKMKRERVFALHLAWGLPLALLFPLLWLGAAWAEGAPREYFQELIFKQNFGRLSGKVSFGKPRPVYFFLLHVPLEFLPWTIFLPASIAALRKAGKKAQLGMLAGWALAVIVFFTLSSGKRNLYVLMAYPAMALIVAGASQHFNSVSRRWRIATGVGATAFMMIMGLAQVLARPIMHVLSRYYGADTELPVSPMVFLLPGIVMLLGVGVCLLVWKRYGFARQYIVVFGACCALHWALIANIVFPALNEHKTPVEVVDAAKQYANAGDKMIIYGHTSEIVPLYCGMQSLNATNPDELRGVMKAEGGGIVVLREEAWRELKPVIRGVDLIGECTVGHKTMVLVGFGRR